MAEIDPQRLLKVAPDRSPLVEDGSREITQWWRPWLTELNGIVRTLQRAVFGITQTHTQTTDVVLGPNTSAVTVVSFPGVLLTDMITVTLTIDLDGVALMAYVATVDEINILYANVAGGNKTLTAPFDAHLRAVPHNFG